jgi:hypothetical protein
MISNVTMKHIIQAPHLRRGLMLGVVAMVMQCATGMYATAMFSTYFFRKAGMSQVRWGVYILYNV